MTSLYLVYQYKSIKHDSKILPLEFQGVFDDENKAINACKNENFMIHEVELNSIYPIESVDVDNMWFPKKEKE